MTVPPVSRFKERLPSERVTFSEKLTVILTVLPTPNVPSVVVEVMEVMVGIASKVCAPEALEFTVLLAEVKVISLRLGAAMLMVLPAVAPGAISATRNNVPVVPLVILWESPVNLRVFSGSTTAWVPREVSPTSKVVSVE